MLADVVSYVSIISILAPIALQVGVKTSSGTNALKCIYGAIWVSLAAEIATTILGMFNIPNSVVANIYYIIFFTLAMFFYWQILPERKSWLRVSLTFYFVGVGINSIFFQKLTEYQGYSVTAGGILLIIWALLYYGSLLKTLPTENLLAYSLFWINSAIIFYFSFSLMLFAFSNFVFTTLSAETGVIFWAFHNVNNIIKNVLFAVGIYLAGNKVVKSNSTTRRDQI